MNVPARLAVVYHSATGTTATLAEAVRQGANSIEGVETFCVNITGQDIHFGRYGNDHALASLGQADALIFGSPTFMGCVSAQFKAFADATSELWAQQHWAGKLAAGFTIGTNLSGDQLSTIQYLNLFANQHGMLWVSLNLPGGQDPAGRNRLGAQSGLIAHTSDGHVHAADLATAQFLGKRVAGLAVHMVGSTGQQQVSGSPA